MSRTRNPFRHLVAALLVLTGVIALVASTPGVSMAQAIGTNRPVTNTRVLNVLTPTASQTFATTSFADLVGSSVTFVPRVDPTVAPYFGGPNSLDYVHVQATLDGTKATATTGSCAPFVNGTIIAGQETFISFGATRGTVTLDFFIPVTSAASQTLKIQCRSGDTNIFTVTDSYVEWEEIY